MAGFKPEKLDKDIAIKNSSSVDEISTQKSRTNNIQMKPTHLLKTANTANIPIIASTASTVVTADETNTSLAQPINSNENNGDITTVVITPGIPIDPIDLSKSFKTSGVNHVSGHYGPGVVIDYTNTGTVTNTISGGSTDLPISEITEADANAVLSHLGVQTVGVGASIFEGKDFSGSTLYLKSIQGINGTTVSSDNNSIYISSPQSVSTGGSSGTIVVFNQPTPLNTWTIVHNLNNFPTITVVDSSNRVVIGDEVYDSSNQITLNFIGAFAGKAFLTF